MAKNTFLQNVKQRYYNAIRLIKDRTKKAPQK